MLFQRFLPVAIAVALAGCGSVGVGGLGPEPNMSGHAVETAGGLPPAAPAFVSEQPASDAPVSPVGGADLGKSKKSPPFDGCFGIAIPPVL